MKKLYSTALLLLSLSNVVQLYAMNEEQQPNFFYDFTENWTALVKKQEASNRVVFRNLKSVNSYAYRPLMYLLVQSNDNVSWSVSYSEINHHNLDKPGVSMCNHLREFTLDILLGGIRVNSHENAIDINVYNLLEIFRRHAPFIADTYLLSRKEGQKYLSAILPQPKLSRTTPTLKYLTPVLTFSTGIAVGIGALKLWQLYRNR